MLLHSGVLWLVRDFLNLPNTERPLYTSGSLLEISASGVGDTTANVLFNYYLLKEFISE